MESKKCHIISQRGQYLAHKTILICQFFLKCLYQDWKVSGHVYCVWGIDWAVMYIVYEVSILWKVGGHVYRVCGIDILESERSRILCMRYRLSGHVYCVWGIDIVESERSRILCMWYRYCGKWAVMYIVYVVSILWKVSGHVYCVCGIDIVESERSRILCMWYRYCLCFYEFSVILELSWRCGITVLTVWYICLDGVVYHVFHSI